MFINRYLSEWVGWFLVGFLVIRIIFRYRVEGFVGFFVGFVREE